MSYWWRVVDDITGREDRKERRERRERESTETLVKHYVRCPS